MSGSIGYSRPAAGRTRGLFLIVMLSLSVERTAHSGGKKVTATITECRGEDEFDIDPPARKIKPARPDAVLPHAAVAGTSEYPYPYANPEANSRVAGPLSAGPWKVRWTSELNPAFPPDFVLSAGDRILVEAKEWRLLTGDGHVLSSGRSDAGAMQIDARNSLAYAIDRDGDLIGIRLTDGGQLFRVLPADGRRYARTYLTRREHKVLIVGLERALDPKGRQRPSKSQIEIVDLGSPLAVDGLGFLTSGSFSSGSFALLTVRWPSMKAASHDDTVVFAVPGRVYVGGWDLKIRVALEADFTPMTVSLDEAGRIYLVVQTGNQLALWLLNQDGDRLYDFNFPPGLTKADMPPVIGYDHAVYLAAGSQIIALGPDGKVNWTKPVGGPVHGAVATGDGKLLATEGAAVVAWDAQGTRTVLFTAQEELRTPPVLTAAGEILAAGRARLYCLAAPTAKR